ncbi:glycosyltransferase family protein [Olleya namhaensis]|uniref:Dolichol-phosphate mannosyltransferase n=1 Tax=Olleya namhaensis TaxID=1144750 RepID=A0A1I3JPC8_9FLAO|nr:hypothetical protein [Olleya namhaensis]SFI61980.1 dolichol-phosphate mannosyltransferase [Olleya namhaensis]
MNYKIKEKNFISVIIHVKDNAEQTEAFLTKINRVFKENFEAYEYIIVNNTNNLEPNQILSSSFLSKQEEVIKIINLSWAHNIEDAMRSGIELAIGDFIFEFDSIYIDFNVDFILKVYYKSLEGYDVVAAEPDNKLSRKSKPFYSILNRLSNKDIYLTTETFRIVSRRMLNRSSLKESFRYRKINYHYSGLKTNILKYPVTNNADRKSDFSLGDKISLGSNILIYYSNIGTKISLGLSLFFLAISISVIGFTLFSYFSKPDLIQNGWTTTMIFLSISFCGIFAILGVLSKYMEVLLREAQIQKPYSFKSIERLS